MSWPKRLNPAGSAWSSPRPVPQVPPDLPSSPAQHKHEKCGCTCKKSPVSEQEEPGNLLWKSLGEHRCLQFK